jgi:transcription antitermination factor NusG
MNGLDTVTDDDVTVAVRAPGARHPECGSHPENPGLIKSATNWGGSRVGAGRKPASVVIAGHGPRWYCIEVQSRQERAVVAQIERLGFAAVAPEFMDMVPGNPAKRLAAREVLRAAFPGYVLGEFDVADAAWRQVASVRGVRRVMGSHPERPSPLPAVHAAWLLSQFGEGGAQRVPRLQAGRLVPLVIGCAAVVSAGPFEGVRGTVLASDGRAVVLSVDGRRVRVPQVAVTICA